MTRFACRQCHLGFEVHNKTAVEGTKCKCGATIWITPPNRRTITLEAAVDAVRNYNTGNYRGVPNLELDRRARETFARGSLAHWLESRIRSASSATTTVALHSS